MRRPSLDKRWHNVVEMRVYDQQYKTILAECGQDAADNANYGWGVSGGARTVDVATKVYGHGVLVSIAERGIGGGWGRIEHGWR